MVTRKRKVPHFQKTDELRDEATLGSPADVQGQQTTSGPADGPPHQAVDAGDDQKHPGQRQRKKPFVL